MGLWAWFKRIVCNKRKKENKSKKLEAGKSINSLQETSNIKSLIEADAHAKQASSALDRIHFWSKIQAELRTRRVYMVKESRIKQKKLQNQLKIESKFHDLEVEWCGGPESMDEIVSKIQQRGEATNKRERAMAYAFSHQWRARSNRCFGQAYYDLSKEGWGWSWMERWLTVCPWETRVIARPIVSTRPPQRKIIGKKIIKHTKTKMLVKVRSNKSTGKSISKANNGTN
ncbi:protein IQ-DOMAIN 10-like [Rutidosis leptorrhynchoides]|uniref:protein IQ-DOMAIN 10-like n=1 Tax=Rutidosis leptorrhynchoides TaxID=125765 RepID=UPI003A9A29E3